MENLKEPLDLIKHSLNQIIQIKCRHSRELKGKLLAFDTHLNMLLEDVEETSIQESKSINAAAQKQTRNIPMLYMRGDTIITVTPLTKAQK
ncbi:hypothetical protein ABPG74_018157 [Tetrahymena malaccensis]